jgi:Leucine-rich repeat (LRR) protein
MPHFVRPSLEMLNLAFNRIERLENVENLPCLRAINLGWYLGFTKADTGKHVNKGNSSTDHNEIKWINVYQPLRSLELLRLSFNRLRVLDASQFPAVKTLYLDDNQLLTVKHLSSMKALDSFSMRDQGGHKV